MKTRRTLFCLILVCCLFPPNIAAVPVNSRRTKTDSAEGSLRIIGLPVGQGDGTVIVCPEFNGNVIIFDLGSTTMAWTPAHVKSWLSDQKINGDRSLLSRLSTVILSHPHTDHYNYVPEVIKPTKITNVFVGGFLSEYKYSGMADWLNSDKVKASEFNDGQRCVLDCNAEGWTNRLCGVDSEVNFTVLAANYASETNEKSVVLRVQLGGIITLMTGDFEGKQAQEDLINDLNSRQPGVLRSTIYKVSHHGASRLANFLNWLQAIQARWAFISSAYASEAYGHPKCETIKRLLAVGSLGTAAPHEIDCSDENRNVLHKTLSVQIYSTRPTEDKVCVISFAIHSQSTEPRFLWECTETEQSASFTPRSNLMRKKLFD